MTVGRAGKRTWRAETILVILLIVILPLLHGIGFLSDYYLNLCGKYLALAILALGMDLIWGYTGILSLGQAVFFGLGAYAMGMHLMLGSSGRGVYGEPIPDFMVWNRVLELPLFWKPFQYFPSAALSALLLPALVATIIGLLTFRRRVSGTYFAILTQAMAYAAWLLFNRNELNLGGTNGLTDFKRLLGFSLRDPGTLRGLYIVTAVGLVGSFILCRWLVGSKMGLVLTAIRDQERRLQLLGYPIAHYKIFILRWRGCSQGWRAHYTLRKLVLSRQARSVCYPRWRSWSGWRLVVGARSSGLSSAPSALTPRAVC